jgi:hypothetical protein
MHDLKALVVLTHGAATNVNRKKAFVYQFFWDADKKLQSAWRKWDFGDGKPVTGAYESGSLFLVMERTDGVYPREDRPQAEHHQHGPEPHHLP